MIVVKKCAKTQHNGLGHDRFTVHDGGLERDIERRQIYAADQTADERHNDIRDKTWH